MGPLEPEPRRSAEELLGAVARGDRHAVAELYDSTAPAVLRLARALVGDEVVAEQVVVETFLQVWRRAPRDAPDVGGARAWVVAIGHRLALQRRRARAGAPPTA